MIVGTSKNIGEQEEYYSINSERIFNKTKIGVMIYRRRLILLKRPVIIITISYIIGILMGLYLKINIALFMCVLFLLIIIFFWKNHKKYKLYFSVVIICFVMLMCSLIRVQYMERKFYDLYKYNYIDVNDEVALEGIIIDIKKETQYYKNYIVKIQRIDGYNKYKSSNILLRVKKGKQQNELKYGNLISGKVLLEKPSSRRNYKGYDYSQFLKSKKIYIIGTANDICVINKRSAYVGNMWISKLRMTLKNNLRSLLPNESANIAIAFLLGDTSLISKEERKAFSKANLSHVLAISGMHVGIIILAMEFSFKRIDKRKGKYFFICTLILFSQLTGGSASVIRAVIMSSIMIVSKLVYRKSDVLNNISISALVILNLNPYNILDLGFQLSFLGTVGIVLFEPKIGQIFKKTHDRKNYVFKSEILKKLKNKTYALIKVSVAANIMILPVLAYTYNNFSLIFLISNVLVTPVLGIMSLVGYITAFISLFSMNLAKYVAVIFNCIIIVFNFIAEKCSKIPFLSFVVTTPNLFTILVYYVIVIYVFYFYRKEHNKILTRLISTTIILVVLSNLFIINNSKFSIYFIDVGQGDSTLIITSTNKTILIDGGGSESSSYDVGESVLLPYLLDRGVKQIDYMIFSHFDSDHCKGLFTVIENLKVKNAIISKQGEPSDNYNYFLKLVDEKKIDVIQVQAR